MSSTDGYHSELRRNVLSKADVYVRTVEIHEMFALVTFTFDLQDGEPWTIPVPSGKAVLEAQHYQSNREPLTDDAFSLIAATSLTQLPPALIARIRNVT